VLDDRIVLLEVNRVVFVYFPVVGPVRLGLGGRVFDSEQWFRQ